MVTAVNLRKRMCDNRFEHRETVTHTTRRSRKVDQQGLSSQSADSPGQHRRRYAGPHARCSNRLGDPGDQPIHDPERGLRRAIGRGQAGTAGGHHQGRARGYGGAQCYLDCGDVGNPHDVAHRVTPAPTRVVY